MARTPSTMLTLGTSAPDFELPDPTSGGTVSLDDVRGEKGTLVVFLSNHCPFVKHIADELAAFAEEYMGRGIGIVGIMANDVSNHPDDAPEKMADEVEARGYPFPYLYDESQEVAKRYRAACTPDFFLFDAQDELVYRGQFDDSRPGNDEPVTGADLRGAADAVVDGRAVVGDQRASIGCNIKWRSGNEPDYFG